ncbi:MAG: glycosyltransferase family 4 protein [Nitrospira sp.]|nr:glycosyltransferase family 4 protein [bacterium]MBL7049050.1 glycosyltransferase family 4 protein [Nitrospira sp.]
MKVALNIISFYPSKGGAEEYAKNFALQLAANGHEVHIFAHAIDIDQDMRDAGLHFHKVSMITFPKMLTEVTFALNSGKAIRSGGFDIALGIGGTWAVDMTCPHGGTNHGWFKQNLRSMISENTGSPFAVFTRIAVMLRYLQPANHIKFLLDKKRFRNPELKRVIAVSKMVKQDVIKYHSLSEDRIRVVYNGVDLKKFNPENAAVYRAEVRKSHGIDEDEVVLLFMANNFRLKGLHCLIRAVAVLKARTNVRLRVLIAGRGKVARFEKLARQLGCAEEIIFAGQVDNAQRYYAASDIFVHPTFYDPCSLVCLEALASGMPVITSKNNGAGEIITEGVEGYVLEDPEDADFFAGKIEAFFDEEVRSLAGVNARKLAKQFPWERNLKEMFSEMVSNRH